MKTIFIFGNGNLSFEDFSKYYLPILEQYEQEADNHFILGDFRGVDTLAMEWLKCKSSNVSIYHLGNRPSYRPDLFKTCVSDWAFKGFFSSNLERDLAMVKDCTHFLGFDFNTDRNRVSGTYKSIQSCLKQKKIRLMYEYIL